jgi:hypothetical protein
MVGTLGAMVGVLVLVGALGLFVTRGGRHAQIRSKLWKLIGFSLLVILIIGYLRAHDPQH